jgi:hypothetical protein
VLDHLDTRNAELELGLGKLRADFSDSL